MTKVLLCAALAAAVLVPTASAGRSHSVKLALIPLQRSALGPEAAGLSLARDSGPVSNASAASHTPDATPGTQEARPPRRLRARVRERVHRRGSPHRRAHGHRPVQDRGRREGGAGLLEEGRREAQHAQPARLLGRERPRADPGRRQDEEISPISRATARRTSLHLGPRRADRRPEFIFLGEQARSTPATSGASRRFPPPPLSPLVRTSFQFCPHRPVTPVEFSDSRWVSRVRPSPTMRRVTGSREDLLADLAGGMMRARGPRQTSRRAIGSPCSRSIQRCACDRGGGKARAASTSRPLRPTTRSNGRFSAGRFREAR